MNLYEELMHGNETAEPTTAPQLEAPLGSIARASIILETSEDSGQLRDAYRTLLGGSIE